MRIGTEGAARQADLVAAGGARLFDSVTDDRFAGAGRPIALVDDDVLEDRVGAAPSAEVRGDEEHERSDDPAVALGDEQLLTAIAVDLGERAVVRSARLRIVLRGILEQLAHQFDDAREVFARRTAY